VAGVLVEQPERDLVQCGLDRADLRDHVDAVAVVFDHPLDAADLALDALEALEELVLGRGVAAGRRGRGGVGGRHDGAPGGRTLRIAYPSRV
jgi:hypothetical protein